MGSGSALVFLRLEGTQEQRDRPSPTHASDLQFRCNNNILKPYLLSSCISDKNGEVSSNKLVLKQSRTA